MSSSKSIEGIAEEQEKFELKKRWMVTVYPKGPFDPATCLAKGDTNIWWTVERCEKTQRIHLQVYIHHKKGGGISRAAVGKRFAWMGFPVNDDAILIAKADEKTCIEYCCGQTDRKETPQEGWPNAYTFTFYGKDKGGKPYQKDKLVLAGPFHYDAKDADRLMDHELKPKKEEKKRDGPTLEQLVRKDPVKEKKISIHQQLHGKNPIYYFLSNYLASVGPSNFLDEKGYACGTGGCEWALQLLPDDMKDAEYLITQDDLWIWKEFLPYWVYTNDTVSLQYAYQGWGHKAVYRCKHVWNCKKGRELAVDRPFCNRFMIEGKLLSYDELKPEIKWWSKQDFEAWKASEKARAAIPKDPWDFKGMALVNPSSKDGGAPASTAPAPSQQPSKEGSSSTVPSGPGSGDGKTEAAKSAENTAYVPSASVSTTIPSVRQEDKHASAAVETKSAATTKKTVDASGAEAIYKQLLRTKNDLEQMIEAGCENIEMADKFWKETYKEMRSHELYGTKRGAELELAICPPVDPEIEKRKKAEEKKR